MTDQNAPAQDTTAAENPETAPAGKTDSAGEKEARSPIERAIVWGGILILLGIVGLEYRAKTACQSNFLNLSNALEAAVAKDESLVEADVKKLVTGFSDVKTEKLGSGGRLDTYTFKAVLKTHAFYVKYGVEGVRGGPVDVIQVSMETP